MLDNWKINDGVFSRTYRYNNSVYSVIYHTPSQTVAFLKTDSAEIWDCIYKSNGSTIDAYNYILTNGHFDGDPQKQARKTLDSFMKQLSESHFLASPNSPETSFTFSSIKRNNCVDPVINSPEQSIGNYMADNHVFFTLSVKAKLKCPLSSALTP